MRPSAIDFSCWLTEPKLQIYLYRFAFRLSETAHDSDDLRQETCQIALEKYAANDDRVPTTEEELRPWLTVILRNKWRERARVYKKEVPVEYDKLCDAAAADTEASVEREVKQNGIEAVIAQYPEQAGRLIAKIDARRRSSQKGPASDTERKRDSRAKDLIYGALTGAGILALMFFILRRPTEIPLPQAVVWDARTMAEGIRRFGLVRCGGEKWADCASDLDEAKALDPSGEESPGVPEARKRLAEVAAGVRNNAIEACKAGRWYDCLSQLDGAETLDPDGENDERVKLARAEATAALVPKERGDAGVVPFDDAKDIHRGLPR